MRLRDDPDIGLRCFPAVRIFFLGLLVRHGGDDDYVLPLLPIDRRRNLMLSRQLARIEKAQNLVVVYEGLHTYGGLAGRDMEAMAQGIREAATEDHQEARIGQVRYLGRKLEEAGIPIVKPIGSHAIFIDARRFLPHIDPLSYPGQALAVELYVQAGIRGVEIGTLMFGLDPHSGQEHPSRHELVRLAIPRRVYTQSHMDYVIEAIHDVWRRREEIEGLRIVDAPKFLRHFTAKLERVSAGR